MVDSPLLDHIWEKINLIYNNCMFFIHFSGLFNTLPPDGSTCFSIVKISILRKERRDHGEK